MAHPLYVAFLWHMHQPYYRDPISGDYALPWTRLHATKDYLHMADVLADYPAVHATFNFVPSLIEQLADYASGSSTDRALRVSLKEQLSSSDKEFLLSFFFNISWDKVINRYPGYRELLRQRQEAAGDWRRFSDQYWLDLIVWFNLAWFDPGYVRRDPGLKAIADKGSGFTTADVHTVVEKSRNIAGPTLDAYRRLAGAGQVELCTSPYYHPILPLLIDSASARQAIPGLALPPTLFAYPEDAEEQIRRGLIAHEKTFCRPDARHVATEERVSQAAANLIGLHAEIAWIASDEDILARSSGQGIFRDGYGHVTNPHHLYQPYAVGGERPDGAPPLAIIFRDHVLSDRIGFAYQHMHSRAAAEDMIHRLHRVREYLGDADQPYLVSIILDGENCWEYYENNGDDFLRHLYGMLSNDAELKTVTMTEYLDQFPPRAALKHLAAGSWIGGDMLTWIGEPAQNEAWDHLARTREVLVSRAATDRATSLDVIGQAWRELYVAEGSDWFWWYSTRNNPNTDAFDVHFREHLAEVYRNLGLQAPEQLSRPIQVYRRSAAGHAPAAYISPILAVNSDAGQSWANAGAMEPDSSSATMQRSESLLRRLYYGYDKSNLYLRAEINPNGRSNLLAFYLSTPRSRANRSSPLLAYASDGAGRGWSHEIVLDLSAQSVSFRQADGYENWRSSSAEISSAFAASIAEIRIPLAGLKVDLGDTLSLVLLLGQDSAVEERQPLMGDLGFRLRKFEQ